MGCCLKKDEALVIIYICKREKKILHRPLITAFTYQPFLFKLCVNYYTTTTISKKWQDGAREISHHIHTLLPLKLIQPISKKAVKIHVKNAGQSPVYNGQIQHKFAHLMSTYNPHTHLNRDEAACTQINIRARRRNRCRCPPRC